MGYEFKITEPDGSTVTIETTEQQAQEFMAALEAQRAGMSAAEAAEHWPGANFDYMPDRPDRVEVDDEGRTHTYYRQVTR